MEREQGILAGGINTILRRRHRILQAAVAHEEGVPVTTIMQREAERFEQKGKPGPVLDNEQDEILDTPTLEEPTYHVLRHSKYYITESPLSSEKCAYEKCDYCRRSTN